jgi:hypothetical protein
MNRRTANVRRSNTRAGRDGYALAAANCPTDKFIQHVGFASTGRAGQKD